MRCWRSRARRSGGQKVGEGLAGAGAGFDDEVTLFFEGRLYRSGHIVLPAAMLEGEGGAGEDTSGREEVVEGRQILGESGCDRDGSGGRQCWDCL